MRAFICKVAIAKVWAPQIEIVREYVSERRFCGLLVSESDDIDAVSPFPGPEASGELFFCFFVALVK